VAIDVYREWLKIESPERPPDYYTLMGLTRFEDDRAVIQKEYRDRSGFVRRYAAGKFSRESQDLLDELARAMLALTDPARKNEYDRKLGRKSKRPPLEKRAMGQILLDEGIVTAEQLGSAQQLADELHIDLRQALVQRDVVSWEEATRALAQQHNLPYFDLAGQVASPELIPKVPSDLALRENVFPLLIDEDNLIVAMTHELSLETLETLRFRTGMPVRAVLASPPAIRALVHKHYGTAKPASRTASRAGESAAEADESDEEPSADGFSLAGWMWRNVKWVTPLLATIGLVGGYFAFELVGALAGGLVAILLVVILLFATK